MAQTRIVRTIACLLPAMLLMVMAVGLSGCKEDDIERSLGSQTAAAVEQQYRMDNDPLLNAWINTMGQTLVGHSTRQQIPYSFKVIDTDMVNAFAAPYGHIYFLRGLLDFAETEDEVWFIAGHEISHVVHRHSIKSVKRSLLYSLGAAILGSKSDTVATITGLGSGLLLLSYSRDNEREADDGGANLMYAAGYDTVGAISFFEKLHSMHERSRPSQLEHLLLTHPPTPTRIARQIQRPILDHANPETAVHLARGYQRRHQFGQARGLFQNALEADPRNTDARLGLADSYATVGLLDEARNTYDGVLTLDGNNRYALRALAALPRQPMQAPAITAAERAQASELLAKAPELTTAVGRINAAGNQFAGNVSANLSQAAQTSRNASGTLLGISDSDPDFTDDQRTLFMTATASVNAANSAVYALETLDSKLANLSGDCTDLKGRLTTVLKSCADGSGSANDVAIAARAWRELSLAVGDYQAAVAQSSQALQATNAAQRGVADTLAYMELMAKDPANDSYAGLVKQAGDQTQRLADAADAAVNKVKNTSRQAEARALLARLNLAPLGQRPEMRQAFDGLVAYYTMSRPEQATALRQVGFGHGDAAFALAATHSTGTAAENYASALDDSLVSTLLNRGAKLQGALVLLRYLANSMEREAQLAEAANTG